MATISRQQYNIAGQQFMRVINCDGESGEFSIELPQFMADALGQRLVAGKTKDALELAWRKAIEDFTSAKTTKKKVILFKFDLRGRIYRDDRVIFNEANGLDHGLRIGVQAAVYEESCLKKLDNSERFSYELVASSIPDSLLPCTRDLTDYRGHRSTNLMEWTAEREATFAKIGEAMEKLVMWFGQVKDADNFDRLVALSAAGRLLPNSPMEDNSVPLELVEAPPGNNIGVHNTKSIC